MLIYTGIVAVVFILSIHLVRLIFWHFDDLPWVHHDPNHRKCDHDRHQHRKAAIDGGVSHWDRLRVSGFHRNGEMA
jgi:hypothetical protein